MENYFICNDKNYFNSRQHENINLCSEGVST